jgi:tRNA (mo5U34)-methyltransferase
VPATRNRRKLTKMAESVPFWYHSIDLGEGVVPSGRRPAEELDREWAMLGLPGLHGKTVLDVGAWDGYFSFRAEEAGAARVVALDHYAWSLDLPGQERYWADCRARGVVPEPSHTVAELWHPDRLPGKAGFDVAHRARESSVESLVGDFMTIDLERLGTFDVVLYLGVISHMRHPLRALERLAHITDQVLVVSADAVAIPGFEHHAFWEFVEGNELDGDVSRWWAPNRLALTGLCRTAGFPRVEGGDDRRSRPVRADALHRYRLVVRAWQAAVGGG